MEGGLEHRLRRALVPRELNLKLGQHRERGVVPVELILLGVDPRLLLAVLDGVHELVLLRRIADLLARALPAVLLGDRAEHSLEAGLGLEQGFVKPVRGLGHLELRLLALLRGAQHVPDAV